MDKQSKISKITLVTDESQKKSLITDYFKPIIIKGYNSKTTHYHCLECGRDMGNYPGQLCR
jgi:hypothetical protein